MQWWNQTSGLHTPKYAMYAYNGLHLNFDSFTYFCISLAWLNKAQSQGY